MLEDHADLGRRTSRSRLRRVHDIVAVDQHLARVGSCDAVDHAHERGLARTREAHHHEDLALRDVERHVTDRDHAPGLGEQFLARQIRIGCAHDAIGLRPVDLPHVATRDRRGRRLGQGVHPLPGRVLGGPHRPDRQIVGPHAEARKSRVAQPATVGAAAAQPSPNETRPATTKAMPAYWFTTGRSCRNATDNPTAIKGNTAEAISTIETRPREAPIE